MALSTFLQTMTSTSNKRIISIIDCDILIALVNEKDENHNKAVLLHQQLIQKKVETIILPTTICELATLITLRIGSDVAHKTINAIVRSKIQIVEISIDLHELALDYYRRQKSKEESLFDCYIMAAANKMNISYIYSFDKGYRKTANGFKLISDYFVKN